MTVEPGQVYRSCDPRYKVWPRRLRVEDVGPHRADVFYIDSQRHGRILLDQLHNSPTTKTGQPRRTGYALETQ